MVLCSEIPALAKSMNMLLCMFVVTILILYVDVVSAIEEEPEKKPEVKSEKKESFGSGYVVMFAIYYLIRELIAQKQYE